MLRKVSDQIQFSPVCSKTTMDLLDLIQNTNFIKLAKVDVKQFKLLVESVKIIMQKFLDIEEGK